MVVPKIPIGGTDSKKLVTKIGTTSPTSVNGMSDGGAMSNNKTIESCDDEDFF